MRCLLVGITIGLACHSPLFADDAKRDAEAVKRSLQFLSVQVPKWVVKNKCYSCHNNGDAARALYTAKRLGHSVPKTALTKTTDFLRHPDRWKHNGGEGDFVDRKLDVVQFGLALTVAFKTGAVRDRKPLLAAAARVAADQKPDGSWEIIARGTLGSPVNYGRILGTVNARRILETADARRFRKNIEKANRWLRAQKPKNVFDAAALLLGIAGMTDAKAGTQRKRCLELIRKGRDKTGGWGPYVNSAAEPFDTALVLLALSKLDQTEELTMMIRNGRRYLVRSQLKDGSWPETTRPANEISYSHRLSTAGWATLALLTTRPGK